MERSGGKKVLRVLVEVVVCLMIAIVLVGLVQQFFLAPVLVSGKSMLPTFHESGDKVFVQKIFFKIDRGDVVVFYRPNSEDVKSENPANSISVSDFFNSLPFVNKIPHLSEEQQDSVSDDYTCVIKRVVGIPGDRIEIRFVSENQAKLYRNGEEVDEPYMMHPRLTWDSRGVEESGKGGIVVGEDELFVLGDNRDESYDSEDYGCIKASWLMGKVLLAKVGGSYKVKV